MPILDISKYSRRWSFRDWLADIGVLCYNCGKFISIIPSFNIRLCGCPLDNVDPSV
jgi:hypothetical protein